MYLWDQVVKQAEITLNLMRQSHLNPKLSAYAQTQGAFNYNGAPLAPCSTCIVAQKNLANKQAGQHMVLMDGTSDQPLNTTNATKSTSCPLGLNDKQNPC
jgi:hypothetical protein